MPSLLAAPVETGACVPVATVVVPAAGCSVLGTLMVPVGWMTLEFWGTPVLKTWTLLETLVVMVVVVLEATVDEG
jgi:hypothetical protein